MTPRRLLLAGLALALAVVAAPAPAAQAAGGPKARADAKRLVRLYVSFDRSMERLAETVEAELEPELESCPTKPPDSVDTIYRMVSIYLRDLAGRGDAQITRFVQRTATFRTRDPAVRRMARRLGSTFAVLRELREPPPRPCAYLEAWEAAGWAEDFRISPPVRNLTAEEVSRILEDRRVARRAARRLRALGVSRSRVDALLQVWEPPGAFREIAL